MMEAESTALLNAVGHPLLVLDAELRVVLANASFDTAFAIAAGSAAGRTLADLCGGAWDDADLLDRLAGVLRDGNPVAALSYEGSFGGARRAMVVDARPLEGAPAGAIVVALALHPCGGMTAATFSDFNHRVRNHFASYASMTGLERMATDDADLRRTLARLTRRLYTYSALYRSTVMDGERRIVELAGYLAELGQALGGMMDAAGTSPLVRVAAEPLSVDIDTAVKIGTIVNELVGTAVEGRGQDAKGGSMVIGLHPHRSGVMLSLTFDGPLPAGAKNPAQKLSADIVGMYIDSLGAKLRRTSRKGSGVVEITLPAALAR